MVKVTKEGNPAWWVGQKVTCRSCGSELELEADDQPTPMDTILGQLGLFVSCPTCNAAVAVTDLLDSKGAKARSF